MNSITFQYPLWYLLFCAVLGIAYAAFLYYKDTTFREQSPRLGQGLGVLRAIVVTILAVLLLAPLLRTLQTEIKKPLIVVAQDESESLKNTLKDTLAYQKSLNDLQQALGSDYEVQRYDFGEKVRQGNGFQFKDKVSNLSDLFKNTYDLYSGQNLGAVVMATDGIFNEGSSPLYVASKLNVPVYTIALGDTTPKKDVVLRKVFSNNIAYLGDKFTVQVDVSAINCVGANLPLSISRIDANGNAQNVSSQTVNIAKNDFYITKEITLDANQAGVQHYRISIGSIAGEATILNNTKDIFVEVLDARTKILLLANSPHPDLSALREALSLNKNYAITTAYANDLKVNVAEFDFAILHQLPSQSFPIDGILKTLNERKMPRLFIVGGQSNIQKLNEYQGLVIINSPNKQMNDVQAVLNTNFGLFTLENGFQQLSTFNPLNAPFGEYREGGNGQVLLYQKIGKVTTKYPLLTLGEANTTNIRTGILTAEGLWRWRLFDYLQHQNHDIFNSVFSKTVQYLSVKEDKRKFRVLLEKNVFNENESIGLIAELYNNSYELINTPDAAIIVTNEKGKQFNYTLNKQGKSYALNLGILPTGNYTYKASTAFGGQQLTASGQFTVQPIQLELFETTANHALLRTLSEQSGGVMVTTDKIQELATLIKQKNTIKPTMYQTSKTDSALNLKWIFGLLLLLLTIEWFLRRWFGGY